MSNTWEIMTIISHFNDRIKNVDKYSSEYDALKELYAEAIRIQCKEEYGYVLTLDDFIESVKSTGFTDYDGCGYFLDKDGTKCDYVRCNAKWLSKFKDKFPYVLWFNK